MLFLGYKIGRRGWNLGGTIFKGVMMYMYIMLAMCTPGALSLGQNGQISVRKAGNLIYVLAKSFKIVFVRKHVS